MIVRSNENTVKATPVKICCPICHQQIEVINRFEKDTESDNSFLEPCSDCKHRETNTDEFPCNWCSVQYDQMDIKLQPGGND
jgi:uncharacterized protein YbaR (Trm112 family)